ncbi:hypothetical protein FACS1894159_01000 [Bacteroidia bacterium]|nr:hypothetical protein FACS1894159_01000 [Bacteroidia bacterium]
MSGCKGDEIPLPEYQLTFEGGGEVRMAYDQTESSFVIQTDDEWEFEKTTATFSTGVPDGWLTVSPTSGKGTTRITLSATTSNYPLDRGYFLEFTTKRLYPSKMSIAVRQEGVMDVTVDPIPVVMTQRSATISASHNYGVYSAAASIAECGILYRANGDGEFKYAVSSTTTSTFLTDLTDLLPNTVYEFMAVATTVAGSRFTSSSEHFGTFLMFKDGVVEGLLKSTIPASGIKLIVPYMAGDAPAVHNGISAVRVDDDPNFPGGDGLAADVADGLVFSESGGSIQIPVTGTATTFGKVRFMITGLPADQNDPTRKIYADGEVIEGGNGVTIYFESFGIPGPDVGANSSMGGIGTDELFNSVPSYIRYAQPNAVYSRIGGGQIRNETAQNNLGAYPGASGPWMLYAGGNGEMEFIISKLNTTFATNIHLEFGGHRMTSYLKSDIMVFYSINGEQWIELPYARLNGLGMEDTSATWLTNKTQAVIPSVANLRLKIHLKSSDNKALRVDDIRLVGDVH